MNITKFIHTARARLVRESSNSLWRWNAISSTIRFHWTNIWSSVIQINSILSLLPYLLDSL